MFKYFLLKTIHDLSDVDIVERSKYDMSFKYFLDIETRKRCSLQEGCYKKGSKSKTYSVSVKSAEHTAQTDFKKSECFQEKSKERYKIKAKNSELKHRHGYEVATSSGLVGMELQGAMAIFTVNLKRIMKLST